MMLPGTTLTRHVMYHVTVAAPQSGLVAASRRETVTRRVKDNSCFYDRETIIMPEVEIIFSPEQGPLGSFRLMELPPDLCKLIESSVDELKCVPTRLL